MIARTSSPGSVRSVSAGCGCVLGVVIKKPFFTATKLGVMVGRSRTRVNAGDSVRIMTLPPVL
jgi:hypothetical protein